MLPIKADRILDLIPQRPPMQLVSELLEASTHAAHTTWSIPTEPVWFCRQGQLLPVALLENMAQTAAAQAGFLALQSGAAPKVGFIGAIKNFAHNRLPTAGDLLHTRLQVLSEVLNFSVIQCEVFMNEEKIAWAELKIVLID